MNAVVQQRNTAPPLLRHDPVLASRSLYAILGSGQSYTAIEIRPGRCPSAISAALSQWCSSSRAPSPVALRDRTGRRVQQPDHVEPIPQFGDRHHPGGAGHRPRTRDPPTRAVPLNPCRCRSCSPDGCPYAPPDNAPSITPMIPDRNDSRRDRPALVTCLLAESGQTKQSARSGRR